MAPLFAVFFILGMGFTFLLFNLGGDVYTQLADAHLKNDNLQETIYGLKRQIFRQNLEIMKFNKGLENK